MLTLSFLGDFSAKSGETVIQGFESAKARALLAYLMLESDKPHRRENLAGLLWGDSDEARSAKSMRQALSNLRKSIRDTNLENPFLLVLSDTIQANGRHPALWLDTQIFESLVSACDKHSHRKLETCAACAHRLEQAAQLYRGELLNGFSLKDSEYFQSWLVARREYFHQKAIAVMERLVNYHQQCRDYPKAVTYARRLVAMDGWREESHAMLMRLLARSSQRSAALRQYQTCCRILRKEFGMDPQPETVQLYQQILNNQFPSGENILPPNNLPSFATSFFGRQGEILQTMEYLQTKNRRLVTLVGPGGVGKTRLALHVGQSQLFAFQDGVFWIALDGIESSSALTGGIASALEIELPAKGEPLTHILNFLRHRDILLIFDNYEQLLPETELIARLLNHAPGLSILVTSREALRLQTEWVIELPGLPFTTELEGEIPAAMLLLKERAQRIEPQFHISTGKEYQEAALLCETLDGLPLGIELAAGLINNHTCAEIAEQISRDIGVLASSLRDVPPRHRSLWAVFERSWNFLMQAEKQALASLGVFPGRFNAVAASSICDIPPGLLEELTRKSLARQLARDVYSLHPLLRQYAHGKQPSAGVSKLEISQKFRDYYVHCAQAWEQGMKSERIQQTLDDISQEWVNLAACWNAALDSWDFETLNMLLSPFFWFFEIKGKIYEGETLFQASLARMRTLNKKEGQGKAFYYRLLAYHGWLIFRRGQTETAGSNLAEALEHGLDSLAIDEQIFAANHLGSVYYETGRKTEAREMHQKAMQLCGDNQTLWDEALTCNHYGSMLSMDGDLELASQTLQRGAGIAETNQFIWITASILSNLAVLAYFRQDYQPAIELFLRSNEKSAKYGDLHRSPSVNHNNLAECYAMLGQLDKASEHLEAALHHFNECGNVVFLPYVYNTLAAIHLQAEKYPEARQALGSGMQSAIENQMHGALNNLLIDHAKYFLLTDKKQLAARIIHYVVQSPDTIKEGQDKASQLLEEYGDDLRNEVALFDRQPLTQQAILEIVLN